MRKVWKDYEWIERAYEQIEDILIKIIILIN